MKNEIFKLRVLSFGMIQIGISDPRSLGSWCIKETDESTQDKDPSVLLMHHDPSDLGSLIPIWSIPKEHTLKVDPILDFVLINSCDRHVGI